MKFKNVNTPNFNFRRYLKEKYDGFFPEGTPTRHSIYILNKELDEIPRREREKRQEKLREINKSVNRYNKVMLEWLKLQR